MSSKKMKALRRLIPNEGYDVSKKKFRSIPYPLNKQKEDYADWKNIYNEVKRLYNMKTTLQKMEFWREE